MEKKKTKKQMLMDSFDAHAKEVSVAFVEWVAEREYKKLIGTDAWEVDEKSKQYSTNQLYDMFINS